MPHTLEVKDEPAVTDLVVVSRLGGFVIAGSIGEGGRPVHAPVCWKTE
jgi:hypothetical protein